MIQINLLPWREEAKKNQQIRFGILVGAFVVLSIFIVIIMHMFLKGMLDNQIQRNTYIQGVQNQKQTEIKHLKKDKENENVLLSKLNFLVGLENKNFKTVLVLNELVNITPENIILTKLERKDADLSIEGAAQTDLDITYFMKSIEASAVFYQPILTGISINKDNPLGERTFELKVEQKL